MKHKKIIVAAIMAAAFVILFLPVPTGVLKDGGTRAWQALTYKIVDWNRMENADTIYSKTSIYFFPNNFKSIDALYELEMSENTTGDNLAENDINKEPIEAENLMYGIEARSADGKAADNEFVASQMKFSLDMLKKAVNGDDNVLVSPLSIMAALAMTANGAEGDTLAGMEDVIADNLGIEKLNEYLSVYMKGLPSDEYYSLKLANSIWFRDDERLSIEKDFLQTNADYYGADIYKAAFDKQTLDDINNWVEKNTDGMIKDILDKIDDDVVIYLINALAFEAEWASKYKKSDTSEGIFVSADGSRQQAAMMNSMEYKYLEDDMATGFIKNYKGGYKFVAILPNEGVSVEEYVASLDEDLLASLINNGQSTPVETTTPKFSYEYDIELGEVLKSLGMELAFDMEKADFSKMATSTRGNICIGRVLHKTFIELNENGTKAGAATVVEMIEETALIMPDDVKRVVLDRPFVYMIVEGVTGLPIFMGTVMSVE